MAYEFIMPLAAAGVQGENHRMSLNMKLLQNVPLPGSFQCHLTGGLKWGKGDDINVPQE